MSSRYEWQVLWYDHSRKIRDGGGLVTEVFANPDEAADRFIALRLDPTLNYRATIIPVTTAKTP